MSVDPEHFVSAMQRRWLALGLIANTPLENGWRVFAETMNAQIAGDNPTPWRVLALPTGSGKTVGLASYCELLVQNSVNPGVLIVSRFIDEIDKLVLKINEATTATTALAIHTKLEEYPSQEKIQASSIIVTTHAGYMNSLNHAVGASARTGSSNRYTQWQFGKRKLIVIDEALDLIEDIKIDNHNIRLLSALIPSNIRRNYPERLHSFDVIATQFSKWESNESRKHASFPIDRKIWDEVKVDDLIWLCKELLALPLGTMYLASSLANRSTLNTCQQLFAALCNVISSPSWYSKKMTTHSVITAYAAITPELDSAVILDATARQQLAYSALGELASFVKVPRDIRDYSKLTIHVLYGVPNSDDKLSSASPEQHLEVLQSLNPSINKNKRFLLCTHKSVTKQLALAKSVFKNMKTAYWGNIDGKNQWADLNTIVVYGLPRPNPTNLKLSLSAFEAWHERHNFRFNPQEEYDEQTGGARALDTEIEQVEYDNGFSIASVIQAINRIACRKIVDGEGGCAPCAVYLLFYRDDALQQAILEGIRQEMPKVTIIENEPLTIKEIRLTGTEETLINYFISLPVGEYPYKCVRLATKLKDASFDRAIKTLKDENSLLYKKLTGLGVSYISERGRHSNSRFVKTA